jgi:hypothetical protein
MDARGSADHDQCGRGGTQKNTSEGQLAVLLKMLRHALICYQPLDFSEFIGCCCAQKTGQECVVIRVRIRKDAPVYVPERIALIPDMSLEKRHFCMGSNGKTRQRTA